MILENLRQNALEIVSMQGKEMELKSLRTTDTYLGKLKRKLSKKDFADYINITIIQRITGSSTRLKKRSLFIYLSISHKRKQILICCI